MRTLVCLGALYGGTALATFLTVFNGYCGEAVSAERSCRFHPALQVLYIVVSLVAIVALVRAGIEELPAAAPGTRGVVLAYLATIALSSAMVGLLIAAADRTPPRWDLAKAAVVALVAIPVAVWLVTGARATGVWLAVAMAGLSTAVWIVALSVLAWFALN